jgi:hypothetical protein
VAWTQFIVEIYEHFDTHNHHLGRLTKMKQYGTMEYIIDSFEHLDLHMEGMSDDFLGECFISGLRD